MWTWAFSKKSEVCFSLGVICFLGGMLSSPSDVFAQKKDTRWLIIQILTQDPHKKIERYPISRPTSQQVSSLGKIQLALKTRLQARGIKHILFRQFPTYQRLNVCIPMSSFSGKKTKKSFWSKLFRKSLKETPPLTRKQLRILLTKRVNFQMFLVEDDAKEGREIFRQMKKDAPVWVSSQEGVYHRPYPAESAIDRYFETKKNIVAFRAWVHRWNQQLKKRWAGRYRLLIQRMDFYEGEQPSWRTMFVHARPVAQPKHLQEAKVVKEPNLGTKALHLYLTKEGTTLFAKFSAKHVGHRVAVVLTKDVEVAPILQTTISGGILLVTLGFRAQSDGESLYAFVSLLNLSSNATARLPFTLRLVGLRESGEQIKKACGAP